MVDCEQHPLMKDENNTGSLCAGNGEYFCGTVMVFGAVLAYVCSLATLQMIQVKKVIF